MKTLEFDDADLRVLNDALVQMPFKLVAPLIAKINQQLRQQEQKQKDACHVEKSR